MSTLTRWPKKYVGCYVDNVRGIYMGVSIQHLAYAYGWRYDPEVTDHIVFANAGEEYDWATENAEDWLNENCAAEGFYFGTSEQGDWGYWPIEED